MRIIELSKDFYSLEEFKKYVGSFNAENTNISIPQKNEILISYHKNDNSLNISILKTKPPCFQVKPIQYLVTLF